MGLCFPFLLLFVSIFSTLESKPEGFALKSGEATAPISDGAGHWIVESGKQAIVEWGRFDVGVNERVTFNQADRSSAILNRVVGDNESSILGHLESNGSVFLINPAGIVIGPNGRVNAAGFIASTLNVLDDDFLHSKELCFTGGGNKGIVHLGAIECPGGDIALLGHAVQCEGSLSALGGRAGIGLGSEIWLCLDATSSMFIRPLPSEQEGVLTFSGTIEALKVELKSGGSAYAKAIQSSGRINASTIKERGGEVWIIAEKGTVAVDGTIIARSEQNRGGEIKVLGGEVQLLPHAEIDVSGNTGGGVALIGGDFQGKNSEIPNAEHIFFARGAKVCADALSQGDGGKVIIWSDEATAFYGNISVRGGPEGGNGGLAEVSGKALDFRGFADRRAPKGEFGTLLLDPINITISAAADSANVSFVAPNYTFTACAPSPANINNATLNANLGAGNVVISTTAAGTGTCTDDGTITVLAGGTISWAATTTLTMTAAQFITISDTITNNVAGSFTAMNFRADGGATGTYNGIQINSALLCSQGGDIILSGVGGTTGGFGVNVGAAVTATNGSITFQNCRGGGSVSGDNNYGVNITAAVTAGTTLTFSDIVGGGTSTSINNYGVFITSGTTVKAVTITATQISSGGGTTNARGFYINGATVGSGALDPAPITTSISITASSIGTGNNGFGIVMDGASQMKVGNSSSILLNGTGSPQATGSASACVGIQLSNSTAITGGTSSNITLIGTGGGASTAVTGSGNNGIAMQNTASISTGGNITFTGVGGYGTGANNYGVFLTSTLSPAVTSSGGGTISFINCEARHVGVGIYCASSITSTTGTISFSGITGGTSGASNYGILVAPSGVIRAVTVTANNVQGGSGSGGGNYGFFVQDGGGGSGGIVGNDGVVTTTTTISLTAAGGGTGNNDYGIVCTGNARIGATGGITLDGTGSSLATTANGGIYNSGVIVSTSGTITATGRGGGTTSGAGTVNYGIQFDGGTFQAATGMTLTGIGGNGSGGGHNGVQLASAISLTGTGTILFKDCRVGAQGTTNSSGIGINIASSVSATIGASAISFQNIVGGATNGNNFGVVVAGASGQLLAPTITAVDVFGGPSTTAAPVGNSNIGFYVASSGRVGNSSTTTVTINATGGGTANSSYGIFVNSSGIIEVGTSGAITLNGTASLVGTNDCVGIRVDTSTTVQAGASGTITLNGTGKGSGSSTSNFGVYLTGGTVSVGSGVSGTGATLTITGVGGSGSGGLNHGVAIDSTAVVQALGTNGAIQFLNCVGGSGGSTNQGVVTSRSLTASSSGGSILFRNISGGSGSGSSYDGVQIVTGATLNAPTITAIDIFGGPGTSSNNGFHVNGGTVGGGSTTTISLTASGGGTSGSNNGILVESSGTITASGTITLDGTGSATTSGSSNRGIEMTSGTLQSTAGSITLTGRGGGTLGSGGNFNRGIIISGGTFSAATGITMAGIGGGIAGSVGMSGVFISSTISLSGAGTILFKDCVGGRQSGSSGGTPDYSAGVHITGTISAAVAGSTISFQNCRGSPAGDNAHGVYLSGTLTSPSITAIDIFGGLGSIGGSGQNIGFYVDGGTVGDTAITTATTSISITATGGGNQTDNNYGIDVRSGAVRARGASATLTLNGTGGPAGRTANYGVLCNNGTIQSLGTLTVIGTGGGSTTLAGSSNLGIFKQSGTFEAATGMTLTGIGGNGTVGNHSGVEIASTISLTSTGTLLFKDCRVGAQGTTASQGIGVNIYGNVTATVGASTISFQNCTGGATGAANHGILISSASGIISAPTITAVDIQGGAGSGGTNIGFYLSDGAVGPVGTPATTVSITATGGGTGINNHGIRIDGTGGVRATGSITLTGTGSSTGTSTNNGFILSGASTVVDSTGGTLTIRGTGGGDPTLAGSNNFGIFKFLGTLQAATGMTLTGIGGNGTTGNHNGVEIASTISLTSTGTLLFKDCRVGAQGTTASNGIGVNIYGNVTATVGASTISFQNCTGGATGAANYGVSISSTSGIISAPTITAIDVFGGTSTGTSNIGFVITNSGRVGNTSTNTISIAATGGGSGSNFNHGIIVNNAGAMTSGVVEVGTSGSITLTGVGGPNGLTENQGVVISSGIVQTGTSGTLILNGTGGGNPVSGTGSGNYGIFLSSSTVTGGTTFRITGVGGAGSGGGNHGVLTGSPITLSGAGTLLFTGCRGSSNPNHTGVGVLIESGTAISATSGTISFNDISASSISQGILMQDSSASAPSLTTPTITGTGIISGTGASAVGFELAAGTIGTSATTSISLTASSVGSGGSARGILVAGGTITAGASGTITLNGTGAGTSASNHGIHCSGGTIAAGDAALGSGATITFTGVGGTGSGGAHFGVFLESGASISTVGTNSILRFLNCTGGQDGVFNIGILLRTALSASPTNGGSILFTNINGGTGSGTNRRGLEIGSTGSADAVTVAFSGIESGTGTDSFGLYMNGGTLGTTTHTTSLTIDAKSIGSGSNSRGIYASSGAFQTTASGTMTLTGVGGTNGTGSGNKGIEFAGGFTVTGGTSLTITGQGGTGSGGSNQGVLIGTSTSAVTMSAGTILFSGCLGSSNPNHAGLGILFDSGASLTAATSLSFIDIAGSGTSQGIKLQNNVGGGTAPSLTAPTITGTGIISGTGASAKGFELAAGTIGDAANTTTISIAASSAGSGSTSEGIRITSGTLQTNSSGTITLVGMGSFSGTGDTSIGIDFTGGTITAGTSLIFTGVGGMGGGGLHYGVSLGGTATVSLLGVGGILQFLNCSGGAQNHQNEGVHLNRSITMPASGEIRFTSVTGGHSGGDANYGARVLSGITLTAATIQAQDVVGGRGGASNTGFFVDGAVLGVAGTTTSISITASSLGTGANNVGIQISGGGDLAVGGTGAIALTGTGGPGTTGCHGIYVTGVGSTLTSVNGAISLTGTAGSASSSAIRIDTSALVSASGSGNLSFTTGALGSTALGVSTLSSGTGSIAFTGPVSLIASTPTISTGGPGDISFSSTLDGAFAISLAAGTGDIIFNGTVGGTAPLTGFTTTGAGFQVGANINTANASVIFANPVTLIGSSTISTTGGIITLDAVDGAYDFALNSGGGAITLGDDIGGTTPLTSFSATGGAISLSGDVTTNNGPISFGDALTLAASSLMTSGGGNISFSSSITGTTAGMEDLTLAAGTGSISVTGAIGATRLDAFTITSVNDATFSSSITAVSIQQVAGTGTTTFNGALNTSGAAGISLTGLDFAINGSVTTTGGGNFTLANSDTAVIGTGGDMTLSGAFAQTGTGLTQTAGDITTSGGNISFTGNVALTGPVTFTTGGIGDITFNNPIDGPSSLALIGDAISFLDPVGEGVALSGLSATGASISVTSDQTTSGAMTYTGPVTVTAPVSFTNNGGGGMTFTSTLTGNFSIALNAPNTTLSVGGNVSTAGTALDAAGQSFTAQAGGDITLSGDIDTTGGPPSGGTGANGGDVFIQSSGGSISVQTITTSGAAAPLVGGNGGAITLQPAVTSTVGALGRIPDGILRLNGNLIALGGTAATDGLGGVISLSPEGRSEAPSIATIVSSLAGNDVTLRGRVLTIGDFESMTIFGNFNLHLTETATVGDVIALDDLLIDAPILVVLGHGFIEVLNSTGGLDFINGAHLIARSGISLTITAYLDVLGHVGLTTVMDRATFKALLTYAPSSYILNYDTAVIPPPPIPPAPPPPSPLTREQFINRLFVATAELSRWTPLFWPPTHFLYNGKICPAGPPPKTETCMRHLGTSLRSMIFEDDVW